MADEQRLIYKVELDDSGYIRATEQMTASTQQLTQAQEQANKTLQTNQAALRTVSSAVQQTKKDLDNYTGSDETHRKQLEKSYKDAVSQQQILTAVVEKNQVAYENAAKAAQDFANTTAKANTVQQQAGGGRIAPTSTPLTPQPAPINILQQFPGLEALPDLLSTTTDEFEQLRIAIAAADEVLAGLNQESEEFKALAPIVAQGKTVLQQYDEAAKSTAGSTVTLRTQLRNNREELVRLEQAGQGASKAYLDLEARTAKLTDEFNDQQQRIRILASDTKLLDFGKAAITAATAAFQGFTSVQLLFGDASEATQKKVVQLFAAMQLLQSFEQLSNLTRREGALATLAQSGAQAIYTAAVGASTGALRAFKLALLGTGIGAAVVVIGLLVKKFHEHAEAIKESNKEQKALNEITTKAADSFGNAELAVANMIEKIKLAKQGFIDKTEVLKEYNETIGKTVGSAKSLDEAEQLLIKHGPDYIQLLFLKAKAQAAGQLAAEASKKAIEDEAKDASSFVGFIDRFFSNDPVKQRAEAKKKALAQDEVDTKNYFKKMEEIQAEAAEFAKTHGLVFEPIKTTKETKDKGIKDIKDDFQQRKDALLKELADLNKTEFETEVTIRQSFAVKLREEIDKISADKSLKPKEKIELIELAIKVNQAELDKALADFNKKVTDAREKLNNELRQLQEKANQDSLNLIKDEFERRKKLIDVNEQKELADQKAATEDRLKALDLDRLLIGEEEYQKARKIIIETGEQEVNAIIVRAAQERQNLSADIFKNTLDAYEKAIDDINFIQDRRQADEVQRESDRFLQGEINYEQFQKNLDKINKQHNEERNRQDIAVLENELKLISARLATLDIKLPTAQISQRQGEAPLPETQLPDTSKEEADLVERQKKIRAQLDNLRKADTEAETKQVNEASQQRLKAIQEYTSAVGDLAQSVISFWQKANEAEQQALDRSITIQQRRVDEAQKIAERGNAEYLKSETDRLTQLQIARENAARRQLAIDAALQASQILVAITGAISKIATPGIGVAETIAEIAIIVGALATGYGLVRSLQGNQPRLKEGTPYLERSRHPAGVDTIPALLTEGEAVIPRERNEQYHPTVKAIYDQKIPAKVINEFVKNYTKKNIITNVVNETSDKKIEDRTINDVLNKKTKSLDERIIDIVSKFSTQNKSEIKNLLKTDTELSESSIHTNEEKINSIVSNLVKSKTIAESDSMAIFKKINEVALINKDYQFVETVSMLVNKTIDEHSKQSFISEYGLKKYSQVIDSINTHSEAVNKIINQRLNNIVSDSIIHNISTNDLKKYNEVIDRTITERKYLPKSKSIEAPLSPAYDRIKEAAELKITHDGRLAISLAEQNELIKENTQVQRQVLRYIKNMGVNVNLDKKGFAVTQMQVIDQIKKDQKS